MSPHIEVKQVDEVHLEIVCVDQVSYKAYSSYNRSRQSSYLWQDINDSVNLPGVNISILISEEVVPKQQMVFSVDECPPAVYRNSFFQYENIRHEQWILPVVKKMVTLCLFNSVRVIQNSNLIESNEVVGISV